MVKQATKGQKEIYQENQSTIFYYSAASSVASLLYGVVAGVLSSNTTNGWVWFGVCVVIQLLSVFFMKSMAKSQMDSKGHVVDAGMDLNDPTAFGEYCKDAVILTVLVQILGVFSNYSFLLLLGFPAAVGYKLFFSFILPWCTSSTEETEEVDEKKMKKKDRREKIVYRH
ncbi:unnamed protein product [Auanema sp. JU1783]|nr:unnamed protein product [Auanema sp. JU1783]